MVGRRGRRVRDWDLKSSSRGPRGFVRVGRVACAMKQTLQNLLRLLPFIRQQVCHSKRQLAIAVRTASHTCVQVPTRGSLRLYLPIRHTQAKARAANRFARFELQLLSHRVSFAALRRSFRAAPRRSARARPFERLRNAAWGVDRLPKTDGRVEARRRRQRTPRPRHVRESREGSRPTA